MPHDHAPPGGGSAHLGRLQLVLALVSALLVVEAAAAWLSGSLTLLADAGHLLTDVVGIGMAVAAIAVARRSGADGPTTYGLHRAEVFAALANAALLAAVAIGVVVEGIIRLGGRPEVEPIPVLAAGLAGLAVNAVNWRILRRGARESINVRGAYLEVLADALGSLAAVVAATLVLATGWQRADAVVAIGVGVFLAPRAVRLGLDAVRILAQVAPRTVDPAEVEGALARLPGVTGVHDLHLWTLTSGMDVATVHLEAAPSAAPAVLERARALLADAYGLDHATVQIEEPGSDQCSRLTW